MYFTQRGSERERETERKGETEKDRERQARGDREGTAREAEGRQEDSREG